jgi:hypothetical protein
MPTTHIQTVEILSPYTTLTHYGQELAPVKPDWAVGSGDHEAAQEEGRVVIWWRGGPCDVHLEDGTIKRFWPKPTIADAIQSPPTEGSYYRFHGNGTVEQAYNGMHYFWGPTTIVAAEPNGYALESSVNICDGYGWFNIFGAPVKFDILPDSYLATKGCNCDGCAYEAGQYRARRYFYRDCDCALCRDDDDDF